MTLIVDCDEVCMSTLLTRAATLHESRARCWISADAHRERLLPPRSTAARRPVGSGRHGVPWVCADRPCGRGGTVRTPSASRHRHHTRPLRSRGRAAIAATRVGSTGPGASAGNAVSERPAFISSAGSDSGRGTVRLERAALSARADRRRAVVARAASGWCHAGPGGMAVASHARAYRWARVVSFVRPIGLLIAGDALTTVRLESAFAVLTQRLELRRPPAYYTTDWPAARRSVEALARLEPDILVSGHGRPLRGERLHGELDYLWPTFRRRCRAAAATWSSRLAARKSAPAAMPSRSRRYGFRARDVDGYRGGCGGSVMPESR